LDVVVVDNDSHDGVADLVAGEFPGARTVWSANHGFGHANNRGLMTCNARYVLFLNPDTEIREGTFADLVALMDARPTVGLAGVRQFTRQGDLTPTVRRFPTALRAFGEALGADRLPRRPRWLGERELDPAAYDRETPCDWVTGSFMLARREALESAGCFDERHFMYADETDLCRRIKTAGWEVRHLPQMTIMHDSERGGIKPHVESLDAVMRLFYARKHLSGVHRVAYAAALGLRHILRLAFPGTSERARTRRAASRATLATLTGRAPVPFAAITCKVAVATADAELRDRRPASAGR
jgi:GT2 family glycosyltransferase